MRESGKGRRARSTLRSERGRHTETFESRASHVTMFQPGWRRPVSPPADLTSQLSCRRDGWQRHRRLTEADRSMITQTLPWRGGDAK